MSTENNFDIYEMIKNDIPNQDFLNSLSSIVESELHNDPAAEVWRIMQTFSGTIAKSGPSSFASMFVLLDDNFAPVIVLEPRPYTSKDDMFCALAEMMFSYSAYQGSSFILATDTRIHTVDDNQNSTSFKECLLINFVSKDSACTVMMPYDYTIQSDESYVVNWLYDHFNCIPLDPDSEDSQHYATGNMTDLFYIMSHIKDSPFNMGTLINYYNFRDFPLIISEDSIAQKVTIEF